MIVLGLLDDAFECEAKCAAEVYKIRVDKHRHTSQLKWKTDWRELPIFRQPVSTPDGIRTSEDEPLRYHTFLFYLQRLGLMAGFLQILNPYNIRRGAGDAVHSKSFSSLKINQISHISYRGRHSKRPTASHGPYQRGNIPGVYERENSI